MLHAFRKKARKMPKKEIELAIKRRLKCIKSRGVMISMHKDVKKHLLQDKKVLEEYNGLDVLYDIKRENISPLYAFYLK